MNKEQYIRLPAYRDLRDPKDAEAFERRQAAQSRANLDEGNGVETEESHRRTSPMTVVKVFNG